MKFTTKLLTLAIASSAAIAPTAFAQSADLSITGRIFPGACTVELSNNGVADLGEIRADTLHEAQTNPRLPVELPMSIACESEVRYGVQAIDNTGTSTSEHAVGLGLTPAGEKIGFANLMVREASADSALAYGTSSMDDGASWSNSSAALHHFRSDRLTGFAKSAGSSTGPDAIKDLQTTLVVHPVIQKREELTIDGDVPINGSATLSVVYL